MVFDILYIVNDDYEVVKVQELAFKHGFMWGEQDQDVRYYNNNSFKYVSLSIYDDRSYNVIFFWCAGAFGSNQIFIDDQKTYNSDNYVFAENFYELKSILNKKIPLINEPFKLENPKERMVYENVNEKTTDVFYFPDNDKDLQEAQRIGKEIGFKWLFGYDVEVDGVLHKTVDECMCILFNFFEGEKRMYYYSSDNDMTEQDIIEENENTNDEYFIVKNINELKYTLTYRKKSSPYFNNNRILVYEGLNKVIKFDDFENLEYRKGSIEFGGILTKLLEFLRLYEKPEILSFKIDDFIKKSNIELSEIEKLIGSKESGQKLYDFDIKIKNGVITFDNLNKTGKNRPFESNNI